MNKCACLVVLALLLINAGSSHFVAAQELCVTSKDHPCNGISVGKPKVFDNRTLTLMIENLSATLQGMQTGFVNQQSVAAALANIQGFQTHEVTSNFQVNTLPIPGVTQQFTKNTGVVDANGNPLPDTTQAQTTTTQNSFTPTSPTLNSVPTFSGFNPNYGENAADLLTDQVNLSYQIFNLRMILDRALSDRLLTTSPLGQNATRLQAVLGFNVTIDPPRTANDAVAVVEIALDDAADAGDLSLVAVMPQEKTYNAASLSTKSHTFGGTAVVKTVQVGYSQRRSGQTFYLYRDNDTISYERMDPVTNQLIFGWMFRPVLGRRSVSPGLRQLFAVVSVPHEDCTKAELPQKGFEKVKALAPCQANLSAKVRTYWKKYDADTLTSFLPRDENLGTRVKYIATLGLTRPELFEGRYTNSIAYPEILVDSSSIYETQLGPQIDHVSWTPVGAKTALVSVLGSNLFTGTQVSLGDKVYANVGDGLILKSNQAMDLSVPLDALAAGNGAVIGRYGPAVPLVRKKPGEVQVVKTEVGLSESGVRDLTVTVEVTNPEADLTKVKNTVDLLPKFLDAGSETKSNAAANDGLSATPLMAVNGNIVPLPYKLSGDTCDPPKTVCPSPAKITIQAFMPDSFISGCSGLLKISYPFLADKWTAFYNFITDSACQFALTRLNSGSLLLQFRGYPGFKPRVETDSQSKKTTETDWFVYAGPEHFALTKSNCPATASAKCTWLSDNFYLLNMGSDSKPSAGAEKAADNKPAVDKNKPAAVKNSTKSAPAAPAASDQPDKIVLLNPYGAAATLDIPKGASTTDPTKTKPIMLHQYDSTWVPVTGGDLSKVQSVEANKLSLQFMKPNDLKPGEKVKIIQVEITRELTSKPGNIDVNVLDTR